MSEDLLAVIIIAGILTMLCSVIILPSFMTNEYSAYFGLIGSLLGLIAFTVAFVILAGNHTIPENLRTGLEQAHIEVTDKQVKDIDRLATGNMVQVSENTFVLRGDDEYKLVRGKISASFKD